MSTLTTSARALYRDLRKQERQNMQTYDLDLFEDEETGGLWLAAIGTLLLQDDEESAAWLWAHPVGNPFEVASDSLLQSYYRRFGKPMGRIEDDDWVFKMLFDAPGKVTFGDPDNGVVVDVEGITFDKGGAGSGNFGHAGRPGAVGGSATGGRLSAADLEVVSIGATQAGAKLREELRTWEGRRRGIALSAAEEIRFGSSKTQGWLFKHNGETVGIAATETHYDKVTLEWLATKRPGVGRAAMTVIAQAVADSPSNIEKLTLTSGKEAHGFYQKLGMSKSGRKYTWTREQCAEFVQSQQKAVVDDEPEDGVFAIPLATIEVKADARELIAAIEKWIAKGGAGSGNFGHRGRPGAVGGSAGGGGSAKQRAEAHLAMVAGRNIPKDLAEYDKEAAVGHKRVATLEDVIGALDASDIPGKVTVIGGVARRGFTQHDIDVMVDAPNSSLVEVSTAVKAFQKQLPTGVSMDAYVHVKEGWKAGDPSFWVDQSEAYQTRLASNHSDWAYTHKEKALFPIEIKADMSRLTAALEEFLEKGGSGSGNWGHSGRPGRRGGSAGRRGGKRTRFTGTFKPRGSKRGREEERSSKRGRRQRSEEGERAHKKPKGEEVQIPGGAKITLQPGEQMVDVGGGVKLPQGMVTTPEAPYGYYPTRSGQPLTPRPGPSRTASARSPFSPEVGLEDRVKQGIRALMGESEMMTPSQRRLMRGIASNVLYRLEQAERSSKREPRKRARPRHRD